MTSSVTRSGEFSPIGRLLYLGIFLEITKVERILGLLFETRQVVSILKERVGEHFGHTNLSEDSFIKESRR
jgi:hypothetical protein